MNSPESTEWSKIPRLPLSEIVRSLGCPEIRREVWDKRTHVLSDARLKNLFDQWQYHGEPNPEVTLERMWPGYHQDNDAVGLILLCSYFDWLTPNCYSTTAGSFIQSIFCQIQKSQLVHNQ
ncbi:MAG TPA: hypothetical protein VIK28_00755 [Sedimentisphaerales bacterium]